MKVRASYKRIGRNPFKIGFDNTDFYTKTVDVPDDYDWKLLEYFAIEDTQEGFEFIQIARIDQDITNANERAFILLLLRNLNKNRQIMKKFTWNDLQERISNMSEEQRQKQVLFLTGDDDSFKIIDDVEFVECDVYVNIYNQDEAGTLTDLMLANGEDFNIEDYKLCTPKGTPFLWDGF